MFFYKMVVWGLLLAVLAFMYLFNRRKFRQIIVVVAIGYAAIILASLFQIREETQTLITIGTAVGALVVAYLLTWGGGSLFARRARKKGQGDNR